MKFSRSPSNSKTALKPKGAKKAPKRDQNQLLLVTDRCFSGVLNLQNSLIHSLLSLKFPDSITSFILSDNPISDLTGFPAFPSLRNLELDRTNISNLKGLPFLPKLASISFLETVLCTKPTCRLALIISQSANLHKINGSITTGPEKQQAAQYPQACAQLVRSGWIPTIPPPNLAEIEQINAKIVEKRKNDKSKTKRTQKLNPTGSSVKESYLLDEKIQSQEKEIEKLQRLIDKLEATQC
ncbi:hypothetical protein TRFO_38865 [Tritrichomonas foetus]|uniref:Leucine Rich Repeat family protein n=1 Tax=Tritrichomonas foetus TaxID=1144522 RepID=A0A1J4JBB9_9EUKA|nr:hypothetical protein TRFO_38865 [Tritrichomonas foetus]|eukprot:OHS94955.1 hypothetical protein TRFO_38865 [Tritrichomonas foetus]